MILAPPIFVSTGTLVPEIDPEELLDPRQLLQLASKLSLPKWPLQWPVKLALKLDFPRRPVLLPLMALHQMGLIPHPHRMMADTAYQPMKKLGECWVEPLVHLGLASRETSLAAARCKLKALIERFPDRKVILLGQSQGGLVVLELALEPEFDGHIAAVIAAGAPIHGVPKLDEFPLELATVFPGVAQMKCDSPSLALLRHRAATEWPLDVPVDLMGSHDDALVPLESALELELPLGAKKREHLILSGSLDHVRMCRHPNAISLVRERVEQFTINTSEEVLDRPSLALVA